MLRIVDEVMERGLVFKGTTLHFNYLLAPLDPSFGGDTTRMLNVSALLKRCSKNNSEKAVVTRVFGDENNVERVQCGKLWEGEQLAFERLYCAKVCLFRSHKCVMSFLKVVSDVLEEQDLDRVAKQYGVGVSFIQGLLERMCVMASQIIPFLELLGPEYKALAAALETFVPRLESGVHSELVDLMQVTRLSRIRARALYAAGYETVDQLALASTQEVYQILLTCDRWNEGRRKLNPALSEVIEKKAAKIIIRGAKDVVRKRIEMEERNSAMRTNLVDTIKEEKDERRKKQKKREKKFGKMPATE